MASAPDASSIRKNDDTSEAIHIPWYDQRGQRRGQHS